jgi:3-oxoacyl-[acyl-carrier protein] reductase
VSRRCSSQIDTQALQGRACSAGIAESDFRTHVEAQTPLGRIGQPQDVAPAVVYLASADSAWVTGQTLDIAGGFR